MKSPCVIILPLLLFFLFSCASDKPVMIVKDGARDYEELALEHYNRGDYETAVLYFEKALEEDQKVNNLPGISSGLHNLARCYSNYGYYDNARKLLAEALIVNEKAENPGGMADNYVLLARIEVLEKDYDRALELLDSAYELYENDRDKKGMGTVLNNRGSIFI